MSMNPDKDVNSPNISQEARRIANAIGAFGDLGTADRLKLLAELMQMATTLADYELFAVCGALLAATCVRAEWWDLRMPNARRDTPEQLAETSNLAGSPGRYFDRISRRFAAFPLRTLSEDSKKKSALRRNRVEKYEQ